MKHRDPNLDPELEAFLGPRKIHRRAPPEIRARALARARAIVAAGGAIPPAPRTVPAPVPLRVSVPAERGRGLVRVALAAAIAVTAGAVGALAALRGRATDTPAVTSPESPHPAPAVRDERLPVPAPEPPTVITQQHAAMTKPARSARAGGAANPFTAELDLLQRAHAAYTRRDFSGALTLVAEHARRFPAGPLAEQREALRVRSLVGSERRDEAHRAAAAFAVRFPRSVLLPRVEGNAKAPE